MTVIKISHVFQMILNDCVFIGRHYDFFLCLLNLSDNIEKGNEWDDNLNDRQYQINRPVSLISLKRKSFFQLFRWINSIYMF
jgi:hypothetical protein